MEILLFIKQCPLEFMYDDILSDLVIFLIFSSDIPLDFHESIRVLPLSFVNPFVEIALTFSDSSFNLFSNFLQVHILFYLK